MKTYDKISLVGIEVFALVLMLVPASALAADDAVNLTPLWIQLTTEYAQPLLGLLASAIVGWFAWFANKRLGLSISDALKKQVSDFAADQAKAILANVVNVKDFNIHIGNPLIAAAAREAILHVNDALKALGITGPAVQAYVGRLIVAHLGDLTKDAPDVPTPAGAIAGTNLTPDGATVPAA